MCNVHIGVGTATVKGQADTVERKGQVVQEGKYPLKMAGGNIPQAGRPLSSCRRQRHAGPHTPSESASMHACIPIRMRKRQDMPNPLTPSSFGSASGKQAHPTHIPYA